MKQDLRPPLIALCMLIGAAGSAAAQVNVPTDLSPTYSAALPTLGSAPGASSRVGGVAFPAPTPGLTSNPFGYGGASSRSWSSVSDGAGPSGGEGGLAPDTVVIGANQVEVGRVVRFIPAAGANSAMLEVTKREGGVVSIPVSDFTLREGKLHLKPDAATPPAS